jgi:hypothetical protein
VVRESFRNAVAIGTHRRHDVLEDHEKGEKDEGGGDTEGGFHL